MLNEITAGAVLTGGRIFGLDMQLVFDILFQGIAVLLLFFFVGYLLIDPVKKIIKERQQQIKDDVEQAAKSRKDAEQLKAEYDSKMKDVENEADEILAAARKKALKNESTIIDNAKTEASRIVENAQKEAKLEKLKVKDEVRVEIISVASAMAEKFVAAEMTEEKQSQLIQETLEEMGDDTWQNE